MMTPIETKVFSELGELEGVILHTPGQELENMTPDNAERALYSDILNLAVAKEEYNQFAGVLNKVTRTFQVMELLEGILEKDEVKQTLIDKICVFENVENIKSELLTLPANELARQLIEGVTLKRNTLTTFLSDERFSLRPLHNFFFTRDASVTTYDRVLISKMANRVRAREAIIMEAIFNNSPLIKTTTYTPFDINNDDKDVTIEGGDVIIARDDITIIGNSARTTTKGIDFMVEQMKAKKQRHYIVVQQLPHTPESFIHLDMVFTLLSTYECMVYEPVILKSAQLKTITITVDNGEVASIEIKDNLLSALKELGLDMKPVMCGGTKDIWMQEREQWHSGANFLAIAPGKVMGYERNVHTMNEMNKNGYEIIKAVDVLSGKTDLDNYNKYVVAIEGSELSRGGGGARCMSMPIRRKDVEW
ncbi:MAG: arginine deiminase [Chlorobi bacterium]|nr:arginine deiminase [Chlorobiota bacterium]